MMAAMAVVTVAVLICLLIHYECLRLTGALIPRLTMMRPRARILVVMVAVFGAHTLEVWFYAGAYWVTEHWLGLGTFTGDHARMSSIEDYVYFSVVCYTTLGFGDIVPAGALRLLSGVEALLGLLLIGWSASFTYLEMQQLWAQHRGRPRRR